MFGKLRASVASQPDCARFNSGLIPDRFRTTSITRSCTRATAAGLCNSQSPRGHSEVCYHFVRLPQGAQLIYIYTPFPCARVLRLAASLVYLSISQSIWYPLFLNSFSLTLALHCSLPVNSLSFGFLAKCFCLSVADHSRSKSTRSRISFSPQEGKMHALWESRGAKMRSSSRSVAPSTCTHFASLTLKRLTSWSSLSLLVSLKSYSLFGSSKHDSLLLYHFRVLISFTLVFHPCEPDEFNFLLLNLWSFDACLQV